MNDTLTPDEFPRDIDALCQMMANATEMENTTIWGTRLGCAAVAVTLDDLNPEPRFDPVTNEPIPTACTRLAAHWPGTTARRVEAIGRAALAGLADLIEPDTPTGVIRWCIHLGHERRNGWTPHTWLAWALDTGAGLRQVKEKAGVVVPLPGRKPHTITCPECGTVIET